MANVFYDHLIDWAELERVLDEQALDKMVRLKYLEHIEHAIHTEILVVIIDHLPTEKHEEFVERFYLNPGSVDHLHYLVSYGKGDVETAIKKRGKELVTELITELV